MVEFDRSAFIAKFQEEATDLLQRLNEGIITLEAEPGNRPLIDQWLRDAHTLKGSSRMVGLMEISDIAHRMEDIMVKVRDGEMPYTPDMTDSFFEALDAVVFLAENAGKPAASEFDIDDLTSRLAGLAATGVPQAAATPEPAATAPAPNALEPLSAPSVALESDGGAVQRSGTRAWTRTRAPTPTTTMRSRTKGPRPRMRRSPPARARSCSRRPRRPSASGQARWTACSTW